jgi:hypothetical protein
VLEVGLYFTTQDVSMVAIITILITVCSSRHELQTERILDKTDEYRRNWFLHLQRMPPNRIPLKSYHYRPQGRRTIGRPKKRWRELLYLWRRNGSKGPILDVYDDDELLLIILLADLSLLV